MIWLPKEEKTSETLLRKAFLRKLPLGTSVKPTADNCAQGESESG